MQDTTIYWLGLTAYSIFVLWIGWRGYRRKNVSDKQPGGQANLEFWAAGRSLGAWSTGLSISASFMSISWSCVYAVQLVYWYGVSSLWLLAIPWLLVMVCFYLLAPKFRRLEAFSQPEMLARRFGPKARAYLALPLAFVFLVWGGAEIFAAAQILAPLLQAPFHLILLAITVVVAGYSFMGGFAAVVSTDKLQFGLVAFFVGCVAWLAGTAAFAHQGLDDFLTALPAAPKTGASAFRLFAAGPALIVMTLLVYLPGWIIETDVWLRLQAAGSVRKARQGVIIASVNSVIFLAILPLVIGLTALYHYPPVAGEIPAALNDGAAIFANLIQDFAPPALSVLLLVGLAAASMSTIDTCGNVMALSLSYDWLEPHLTRKHKQVDLEKTARFVSLGSVLMAYIYATFTDSLWDIFYLSSGILTTTVFLPIVAVFKSGITARQTKRSVVVGFTATIVFYFLESKGFLGFIEPEWLAETGLGYIAWAFAMSLIAFLLPDAGNRQNRVAWHPIL